MNIAIISSYISLKKGTGIARYYLELTRRLKKIKKIEGSNNLIGHLIILPLKVLVNSKNTKILHAVTPIDGLGFLLLGNDEIKKIITYHDIGSYINPETISSKRMRWFSRFYLKTGFWSDKIIADSTKTKRDIIKHLKLPEDKIVVINIGVDEKFRPLNLNNKQREFILGYVGALDKRKRLDYTIRTLKILKDKYGKLKLKFHVYGSGRDLERLETMVKTLNLDDIVEFKGFAPDEKLVEIYNSFDIFVLASDWEGFGIPILEAQRCGVPTIIRKDADIPEEVRRYCIKVSSEEELADVVYNLYLNTKLRRKWGYVGRRYAQKFSWYTAVEKILKVYKCIGGIGADRTNTRMET